MKGYGAPTSTAQHQADTSNVSDEMYIQLSRSTWRTLSDKKPFDKLLTYTDWERPSGNPKAEIFTNSSQNILFSSLFDVFRHKKIRLLKKQVNVNFFKKYVTLCKNNNYIYEGI